MTSLATAFVTIKPDTTGFGARLSKSTNLSADKAGTDAGKRLTSRFGSALKLGGVLAGAFAVTKGVSFFKDAIAEATEARKVGAQTAAVLKSTGGAANINRKQIEALAGSISNKTAIDDEAIQSGANLLLTFKNIRNETGAGNDIFNQTTSIMTDMATAMGKEPKDAAIQLGKALNDPIKGVSALSRVGVTFTESQKETIKRLVDTGNTMGAQKLILRELNSEFKGSAEAQATPAEKAGVAWGNFKELMGTFVLPIIDRVATIISNKVLPAMTSFVTGIQNGTGAGGKFADIVRTIWDALSTTVGFLIRNKEAVGAFVGVLGGFLIISKITKAVKAFNLILAANPIGLAVVALAALAAGLVYAYKRSETFRNIVDKAWAGIKKAVSVAWNAVIKPALLAFRSFLTDRLMPAIRFLWNNVVKPVFKGIGAVIKFAWNDVVKPVFAALRAYLTGVLFPIIRFLWNNVVKPVFKGIGKTIDSAWNNVIRPVFKALRTGIDNVRGAFRTAVDKIGDIWAGLKDKAKAPIRFVVNTVFAGMAKVLNKIPGVSLAIPHVGFDRGGYTGPGPKMKPAGIVHADEHVWTKAEMSRFPGGHEAMARFRKEVMHGALSKLPGFFLGGGVNPMPASTSASRHSSGYPWARWAGDLNGSGDDTGKTVRAWNRGIVASTARLSTSYGNHIKINHPGNVRTLYAHLSQIAVRAGQSVARSQRIGAVGSTGNSSGPHLHFELAGGSNTLLRGSKASGGGTDSYFDTVRKYPDFRDPLPGIRARIGDWKDKLSGMGEWGKTIANLPGKLFGKIAAPGGYVVKKVQSALTAVKKVLRKVTGFSGAGPSAPTGQLVPAMKAAYKFASETLGIKTIYGYSNRNIAGTSTKSDHAYGKALDLMGAQQNVADYFATGPGHRRFNIENTIYNRRIHNARGWHAYTGASPHTDHVHIDTYDKGGLARGKGALVKNTVRPERVLSPRQTESFDRLVTLLDKRGGGASGPFIQNAVIRETIDLERLERQRAFRERMADVSG